jgi:predicted esterase
MNGNEFHQGQPVLSAGQALDGATAAMILLHGRGASAWDMLPLAEYLPNPAMSYLAPQAAGNSWWPARFMDPVEINLPWLESALQVVAGLVARVEGAGISAERTILAGFSQGAILASEFAARYPRRYGGVLVFSGGLFGPPGTPRDYPGSLDGTPVFIGCSTQDPYLPLARVEETATVLAGLGGKVNSLVYPGGSHTITAEEIARARLISDRIQ